MTWQPIETAPKDDSSILVWGANLRGRRGAGAMVARWVGDAWAFGFKEPNTHICLINQPTHWMPLPEPPK